MKKNKVIKMEDILTLANEYITNFDTTDQITMLTPTNSLQNRMILLADAKLQGWGAKIKFPSGKLIPLSTIRQFVKYCHNRAEVTCDGPLDIMDRIVGNFCYKHGVTAEDRKLLDDLCYDVNTLDL